MKQTPTLRLVIASICATMAVLSSSPIAADQRTADPFVGTWTLNVAKSKYSPGPPPKSATVVITTQNKIATVMMDTVNAAGVASHWMYSAPADGKDHPVTGNPDVDAVTLKQIDPRTVEVVQKKSGKATLTVRRAVSADGKTMTVTSTGRNAAGASVANVAVYERKS